MAELPFAHGGRHRSLTSANVLSGGTAATTRGHARRQGRRQRFPLLQARRVAHHAVHVRAVLYGPVSLGLGMARPFLVDLDLSLTDIGWVMGTGGSLAGLAGAMLAGSLINPLGRRGAIVCFGLVQAALIGGMALVAQGQAPNTYVITVLVCAEMFTYSTFFVAVATVAMDWSSLAQAGTDYTIMQCCMFLTGIVATAVGGVLAGAVGWAAYFVLSAVSIVIGLRIAVRLFLLINEPRRIAFQGGTRNCSLLPPNILRRKKLRHYFPAVITSLIPEPSSPQSVALTCP